MEEGEQAEHVPALLEHHWYTNGDWGVYTLASYQPSESAGGPVPTQRVLAASPNHDTEIFNSTSAGLHTLPSPASFVATYTLPAEGRPCIFTCDDEGLLQAWDGDTYAPLWERDTAHGEVTCLHVYHEAAEGRPRVVTGGKHGSIRIWRGKTGDLFRQVEAAASGVSAIESYTIPDPDRSKSRLVTGHEDGSLKVYDPETGQRIHRFEGRGCSVPFLACFESSDGGRRCVASASRDGVTRLYDGEAGSLLHRLGEGGMWDVRGLVVYKEHTSGRTRIATGVCEAIFIWDAQSGALLQRLAGRVALITRILAYQTEAGPWRLVASTAGGSCACGIRREGGHWARSSGATGEGCWRMMGGSSTCICIRRRWPRPPRAFSAATASSARMIRGCSCSGTWGRPRTSSPGPC
jgi:WD40 repeat protein